MYQETILDNGLRVITVNMPHSHSVSMSFFIGVGSRYETEAEAGTSHFIEHLCFKGTHKRNTARDISAAIEGVGGILNGGTDKELTVYWGKVARPHFLLMLDVLSDMLRNSRFVPEDIDRERQVIIEEINRSKDSPAQEVNLLIDELLWSGHPMGRDIAGTKESVAAISREMMLDFMARQYVPGNTVVSVAGDLKHEEAVAAIEQAVAGWTSRSKAAGFRAYHESPFQRVRVERRDTEQVHMCLAFPGLPLLHPKRFILDLFNVILGEGMSSRLFTEIRDRLGLAYSIGSYVEHFSDTGAVTIYAGVEPRNLAVAVRAIVELLFQLREPVPEDEMVKARELSKGRLLLSMEDSRNLASWVGGQEILTGRILTIDQALSIVDAITADDIKGVADDLLVGSKLRLAVVGPVSEDESLEELLTA